MFLDVGDGHHIYYSIHGDGSLPVIVLHGGPGAGHSPEILRLFNLRKWRVMLWDQRGCGRSRYTRGGRLFKNTTWNLVADIERLRAVMGCESWTVFGGSWGSTLALAYASKHMNRINAFVLRGVSLLEPWENRWLYGSNGVARLFPEEYARFRRVITGDYPTQTVASAWNRWESILSTLGSTHTTHKTRKQQMDTAVLETHYFSHNAWIPRGLLLETAKQIPSDIPMFIVQGRFDFVCPPAIAVKLANTVKHSKLFLTDAGHAWTEPTTEAQLKAVLRHKVDS